MGGVPLNPIYREGGGEVPLNPQSGVERDPSLPKTPEYLVMRWVIIRFCAPSYTKVGQMESFFMIVEITYYYSWSLKGIYKRQKNVDGCALYQNALYF